MDQFIDPTPDAPESPAGRQQHGGRRPGAGAKPGNVNALKHGRRSERLRNSLPLPELTPHAIARRVERQQQRAAERIAASALRVAVHAAHLRAITDAVAEGRPLPLPPTITCTNVDIARVRRYVESATLQANLARAQADGKIDPQSPAIQRGRHFAESVEQILPVLAVLLNQDAHPSLGTDTLAGFLTPPHNQADDQLSATLLESAATALDALAESTTTTQKYIRTIKSEHPLPGTDQDPASLP